MLRAHDVVGAAVRLARDHGELGHGRLAVGVEQLRPVLDDAAVLLRDARQEARHVLEGDQRDVERVAEADEARALHRGVDVEHAGEHGRLVGDDAHRVAAEVREADDDVLRVVGVHLVEAPLVHDTRDDIVNVVRLVRTVGHEAQ